VRVGNWLTADEGNKLLGTENGGTQQSRDCREIMPSISATHLQLGLESKSPSMQGKFRKELLQSALGRPPMIRILLVIEVSYASNKG
jgi:hypothetical protein